MIRRAVYLSMGATSCLIGATIILWVLYKHLIHRLPEFHPAPLMGAFCIGPVLCIVGVQWIRKALTYRMVSKAGASHVLFLPIHISSPSSHDTAGEKAPFFA